MAANERWAVIPQAPNYEISDHGNVRATVSHAAIRPVVSYPIVKLREGGRRRTFNVHRLVAEAFVPRGGEDSGVVRHLDGTRDNNHFENLAWGTPSENVMDSVRAGTHWQVQKTHCPKSHAYDDENTRLYDGRRYCRACARA